MNYLNQLSVKNIPKKRTPFVISTKLPYIDENEKCEEIDIEIKKENQEEKEQKEKIEQKDETEDKDDKDDKDDEKERMKIKL